LIPLPSALQKTRLMPAIRVPVRPVHNTALFIPCIFAVKFHLIPLPQRTDPRRNIDIMRNQNRLTRRQLHDKPLMPRTAIIVRQYLDHNALSLHLHIAYMMQKTIGKNRILGMNADLNRINRLAGLTGER
jgi:hypothetical protein